MKPRPASATPAARTPEPLPGSGRPNRRHGLDRPLSRWLPAGVVALWGCVVAYGLAVPGARVALVLVALAVGALAVVASAHDPP